MKALGENTTVLVTRPADRAEPLCRLLVGAGFIPVRQPALVIEALNPDAATLADARSADWWVFVSPAAVNHGRRLGLSLADYDNVAIGETTAAVLREAGASRVYAPDSGGYTSEELLAGWLAQVRAGQRVVIVRGQGGREAVASALRERGATVNYLEVYRRVPAAPDREAVTRWLGGHRRFITVTSVEGWTSLQQILSPWPDALRQCHGCVTISERISECVRQDGFDADVVTSDGPTDNDLYQGIMALHRRTTRAERP